MKLFTTIFLLVFATASALASIDPQDLTVQQDVTSGTIIFRSTIALPVASAFKIADAYGNIVHTDSIAKGDFVNKRFKAQLLMSNTYNVIISSQAGKTTVPIKLTSKGIIANIEKAKYLVYPTMNFRSDRTLVVAYDNKSGKRVDIKIANDKGETIFTDQVASSTTGIHRSYELGKLQSGAYQLIVSSRDVKNHTTAFALR
jgi:hypothetical protein